MPEWVAWVTWLLIFIDLSAIWDDLVLEPSIAVLLAPLWAEYLRHWWISGIVMLSQSLTMGGPHIYDFPILKFNFLRESAAGSVITH